MNLRPQVFEIQDQARAEELQKKMRGVIWLCVAGFGTSSYIRFWQIKTNSKDVKIGLTGIFLSYLPALIYYQYHQKNFNQFVSEVSERYKDRIRDD